MTDDLTVQLLRKDEFFSHDLFDYAAETAVEALAAGPGHAKVEQMTANPAVAAQRGGAGEAPPLLCR